MTGCPHGCSRRPPLGPGVDGRARGGREARRRLCRCGAGVDHHQLGLSRGIGAVAQRSHLDSAGVGHHQGVRARSRVLRLGRTRVGAMLGVCGGEGPGAPATLLLVAVLDAGALPRSLLPGHADHHDRGRNRRLLGRPSHRHVARQNGRRRGRSSRQAPGLHRPRRIGRRLGRLECPGKGSLADPRNGALAIGVTERLGLRHLAGRHQVRKRVVRRDRAWGSAQRHGSTRHTDGDGTGQQPENSDL